MDTVQGTGVEKQNFKIKILVGSSFGDMYSFDYNVGTVSIAKAYSNEYYASDVSSKV